jgi:hypothetical protein
MSVASWTPVKKSLAMRQLERDNDGKDIRDILIDALVDHDTDKLAADALDIDNSTLSTWISKLRIDEQCAAIRNERGDV